VEWTRPSLYRGAVHDCTIYNSQATQLPSPPLIRNPARQGASGSRAVLIGRGGCQWRDWVSVALGCGAHESARAVLGATTPHGIVELPALTKGVSSPFSFKARQAEHFITHVNRSRRAAAVCTTERSEASMVGFLPRPRRGSAP
jgi:hypothetical protein